MIFLTIGTHEPFDRLVKAVDAWCESRQRHDVIGQITDRADYLPRNFEFVGNMSPADYERTCQRADLLVAHAGMGSIIAALTLAKPIVILPRRGHLNETRNDHQVATVERFRSRPGIFAATDESDFFTVMDQAVTDASERPPTLGAYAQPTLIEALRRFIG